MQFFLWTMCHLIYQIVFGHKVQSLVIRIIPNQSREDKMYHLGSVLPEE